MILFWALGSLVMLPSQRIAQVGRERGLERPSEGALVDGLVDARLGPADVRAAPGDTTRRVGTTPPSGVRTIRSSSRFGRTVRQATQERLGTRRGATCGWAGRGYDATSSVWSLATFLVTRFGFLRMGTVVVGLGDRLGLGRVRLGRGCGGSRLGRRASASQARRRPSSAVAARPSAATRVGVACLGRRFGRGGLPRALRLGGASAADSLRLGDGRLGDGCGHRPRRRRRPWPRRPTRRSGCRSASRSGARRAGRSGPRGRWPARASARGPSRSRSGAPRRCRREMTWAGLSALATNRLGRRSTG